MLKTTTRRRKKEQQQQLEIVVYYIYLSNRLKLVIILNCFSNQLKYIHIYIYIKERKLMLMIYYIYFYYKYLYLRFNDIFVRSLEIILYLLLYPIFVIEYLI